LPVSVGIAPNKTLAKIANRRARKLNLGVFELTDKPSINAVLAETPVNEVWGIGYKSAQKLNALGIKTALQLKNADRRRVRNLLSVAAARIAAELDGEICLSLELAPPPRKSVTCSRSFGTLVESFEELNEALYEYLVKAAEKMRRRKLAAKAVTVFLATNRFAEPPELYSESSTVELAQPTNSTRELREWATEALRRIYKSGFLYKKTGVILHGLLPEADETRRLSGEKKYVGEKRLMEALDKISKRFGAGAIRFGVEPKIKKWQTRAEMKSRRYTTCFTDILQAV
jgi:DNA polymerase V